MRKNKWKLVFIPVVILAIAGGWLIKTKQKKPTDEIIKEITVSRGSIKTFISCTGTVMPKNRLEIKPPVSGRIEQILAQEGDKVKAGQILAWMSSTERAALLDAARGKGADTLKYWQETYKAIPLSAPIDGEVIVGKTQSGQTVTTADAVLVLSDQLIVRAQVDETDIGKITPENLARISLDAYPDTKINAVVSHIYYESKVVNNVTTYEIDLIPQNIPAFFRSGMNATIDFTWQDKENVLLIPVEALLKEKEGNYVLLKQNNAALPVKIEVGLGISDDKNIEVVSGVIEGAVLIIKTKKYRLPKNNSGSNPLVPMRRR